MSDVFVIGPNKQPLNPVHPGEARLLLKHGKAAVFKRYPFTLRLKEAAESPPVEPLRIKLDPGSKVTGIALVNDATGKVVFAAYLEHRGQAIKHALDQRRAVRRARRQRKTRYRQPRFLNRRRPVGWIAPSLESRVANVITWVQRLCRLAPITAISPPLGNAGHPGPALVISWLKRFGKSTWTAFGPGWCFAETARGSKLSRKC